MLANIKNFGSHDAKDYQTEVNRGGRFVYFEYCVSIIFYTYKTSSGIYLIRGSDNYFQKAILFSSISFVAGWWGIPWGPIYTIQTIFKNLSGGKDVTHDVMDSTKSLNPRNQYF